MKKLKKKPTTLTKLYEKKPVTAAPKLAQFDVALVRSCCERNHIDPRWKSIDSLLLCLDRDSPAHRATAQIIRSAMNQRFDLTLSCFVTPAIKLLFGVEV